MRRKNLVVSIADEFMIRGTCSGIAIHRCGCLVDCPSDDQGIRPPMNGGGN